jgi:hypothetical protein
MKIKPSFSRLRSSSHIQFYQIDSGTPLSLKAGDLPSIRKTSLISTAEKIVYLGLFPDSRAK